MDKNSQLKERRERILELIADDIELQSAHLDLLRRQKKALVACDREEFGRLHAQYEDFLIDLELQDRWRVKYIRPGASIKEEVALWPAADQKRVMALVTELKRIVGEVSAQRKQNHVLIGNDLKLINFQLNLFMAAANKGFQYVKSGASVSLQANRLINRTA
jgi:hypothetical protein